MTQHFEPGDKVVLDFDNATSYAADYCTPGKYYEVESVKWSKEPWVAITDDEGDPLFLHSVDRRIWENEATSFRIVKPLTVEDLEAVWS